MMTKSRILQIYIAVFIVTILAAATALPFQAAPNYSYQFEPDPNYAQSDTKARLKIYAGGVNPVNPTSVTWIEPGGNSVSYCIAGGCGTSYDQSVGDNGLLIWRAFNFYISGQQRLSGTYTAIVYQQGVELFRDNFSISGSSITPTPTVTPVPLGVLDSDFGTDGKTIPSLGEFSACYAAAIQTDQKILATGYGTDGLALVRYTQDGNLDTSFDTDGIVFPVSESEGRAIAVQDDGKIVVTGTSYGHEGFLVARLNTNGSPDTSFGTGGKVLTIFGDTSAGHAIVLQNDGKIVVAGYSFNRSTDMGAFALARYNPNGSLDTSFGTGGKVVTEFSGGDWYDHGLAVALQDDGKIVVAGRSNGYFALARYLTNGALDTSFGIAGKVTTEFGSGANDVVIQEDGKILAVGEGNSNVILARFLSNGQPDDGFGVGGEVISNIAESDGAYSVALLDDGKILIGGYSRTDSDSYYDFLLARYNPDGSLDTQDTSGTMITDVGGDDLGHALVIQPDGKILLVGRANSQCALVRYDLGTEYRLFLPMIVRVR